MSHTSARAHTHTYTQEKKVCKWLLARTRLKVWHADRDCKGHISVEEEMLKCDVWCSMWFCILALCLVHSVVVRVRETGWQLALHRHQCRRKITAQSVNYTNGKTERKKEVVLKGRDKRIRKEEWGVDKKIERKRQKATASNCPWHKSSNWCWTVKTRYRGKFPLQTHIN